MTDFAAPRTFQEVYMAVGVASEVRQHVALRPALEKRWRATVVVGEVADGVQQQLMGACAALDMSIQ